MSSLYLYYLYGENGSMKRFMKIVTVVLFILCFIGIGANSVSAKNIYFAGEYNYKGKRLILNQYSSPESSAYGKNVGNFEFSGFKNENKNISGQLYKKGMNKYQTREGFITFIIKKKSVVIKGGTMDWNTEKYYSLKGKYKLKERYERP